MISFFSIFVYSPMERISYHKAVRGESTHPCSRYYYNIISFQKCKTFLAVFCKKVVAILSFGTSAKTGIDNPSVNCVDSSLYTKEPF
jgi:hypothetical protein